MTGRGVKKFTMGVPEHPFSLLTLLSDRDTRDKPQENEMVGGGNELRTNEFTAHYQTQAADLSLAGASDQIQLGDMYPRTPVFTGNSPVPPPPPLAHHQPYEETFYNSSGLNPEYLGGEGHLEDYEETLTQYSDYYSRYPISNPYSDTLQDTGGQRNDRLYDYSLANNVKQELSDPNFRYMDTGNTSYLVPPPLHPSPAVLLHIKYVMESVCDVMFFTDVTIITSSDTLRAHRSVLSAHSSFLCYLFSEVGEDEDSVLYFPHHTSLYVRMLLQFFYTGEVTRMTQGDIEPLRDICYCLGVSSLIARLDDVKLTISFQSIPSYDNQIPHVDSQIPHVESQIPHVDSQLPHVGSQISQMGSQITQISHADSQNTHASSQISLANSLPHVDGQISCVDAQIPHSDTQVSTSSPQRLYTGFQSSKDDGRVSLDPCPSPDILEEAPPGQSSCKFQEQKEKSKNKQNCLDVEYHKSPTRQYTVVSKMPRDTKLQISKKCPFCKLKFFKSESYENHLKLHKGETFKCDLCNKSISSKYHLKIHRETHSNKKYPCNFTGCSKEFSDPSVLRRHHRNVHAEIKHVCNKCGAVFGDRNNWKRHQSEHSPSILFSCASCGKKFKRKSQLKRHKMNVHKKSAEARLDDIKAEESVDDPKPKSSASTCNQCNAVFRKPYDLKIHMRVHTGEKPFQCTMCSKAFSRSYNLQLHIRTHTGEKPHACARCGRCFSDVAAFRRHCRTHSGERPYPCTLCGAWFTQASTASNHMGTCRKKRLSLETLKSDPDSTLQIVLV